MCSWWVGWAHRWAQTTANRSQDTRAGSVQLQARRVGKGEVWALGVRGGQRTLLVEGMPAPPTPPQVRPRWGMERDSIKWGGGDVKRREQRRKGQVTRGLRFWGFLCAVRGTGRDQGFYTGEMPEKDVYFKCTVLWLEGRAHWRQEEWMQGNGCAAITRAQVRKGCTCDRTGRDRELGAVLEGNPTAPSDESDSVGKGKVAGMPPGCLAAQRAGKGQLWGGKTPKRHELGSGRARHCQEATPWRQLETQVWNTQVSSLNCSFLPKQEFPSQYFLSLCSKIFPYCERDLFSRQPVSLKKAKMGRMPATN